MIKPSPKQFDDNLDTRLTALETKLMLGNWMLTVDDAGNLVAKDGDSVTTVLVARKPTTQQ